MYFIKLIIKMLFKKRQTKIKKKPLENTIFLFCPHSYSGFVISFYINGLCLTNINHPHSVRDACQSGRCLLDLTFNVFFSCIVFGTADIFRFLSLVPLQYSFFTLASEIVTGTTPVYQRLFFSTQKDLPAF